LAQATPNHGFFHSLSNNLNHWSQLHGTVTTPHYLFVKIYNDKLYPSDTRDVIRVDMFGAGTLKL
jgi:hypothetical protein